MKIAVFSTCPKNAFSGGRYHAMMIAHVLARRGHTCYFVTNNEPIFAQDLAPISSENPVRVVIDEEFDVGADGSFDAVFVAPQMSFFPRLYKNAVRFARESGAQLFLINYEAANWFNAYSPVKRPEEKWREWMFLAKEGAMVLSSAYESMKYAKDYYVDLPYTASFDVWQPSINSVACAAVPEQPREKLIVFFSRPSDKHKGGGDIADLIGPELSGYKIGLIIGNPQQSESFIRELKDRGKQHDIEIEPYFGLSDIHKFVLLKRASAVVFPSYFEGYGYPPLEALACDTPCVAYDLPVIRENCGDLIEYAPVGDIKALQKALLSALEREPQRTSQDPKVIYLTDVDERGKALEEVIKGYAMKRLSLKAASHSSFADQCQITPASTIFVNSRPHLLFNLTTDQDLCSVTSDCKDILSAQVIKGPWHEGAWRYDIIISFANKNALKLINGQKLELITHDGQRLTLPLSELKRPFCRVPWLSAKAYGVDKLFSYNDKFIISGWVFPRKSYDTLFLMDRKDRVVRLQAGIKNERFKKSNFGDVKAFCGFISDTLGYSDFDPNFLRLILVRNGKVIAKGRLSLSGAFEKAQDYPVIGKESDASDALCDIAQPHSLFENEKQTSANESSKPVLLQPTSSALSGESFCAPLIRKKGVLKSFAEGAGLYIYRLFYPRPNRDQADQITIDGAEVKWVVSSVDYEEDSGELVVDGWITLPGKLTIEVWSQDFQLLGKAQNGLARPDVAKDLNVLGRDDFGFEYRQPYDGELNWGVVIKLMHGKTCIFQKFVESINIKQSTQLKVDDYRYDDQWHILWMRGSFQADDTKLESLEVLRNNQIIAKAAIDEKFRPDGKLFYKWRVESLVNEAPRPGEELLIKAGAQDKVHRRIKYRVPVGQAQNGAIASQEDEALRYAKGLAPLNNIEYWGEKPIRDAKQRILLVIHNLNAIERGEKRRALEQLRQELNRRNIELICLHHAKQAAGCAIPEINFFSDDLEDLSARYLLENQNAKSGSILARKKDKTATRHSASMPTDQQGGNWLVDPYDLDYARRMLYGFSHALNRRPFAWEKVESQTNEEVAKVEAAISAVKPSLVLVWHQWNSLMILTRALAERRGIPSAVIHEGMLPGTMTLDAIGMMAESDCTGVALETNGPEDEAYFSKARYVIEEISSKGLDRKPHAGTPAATQLLEQCKAKGIKTVFYAGVNDWQSGNLPADHPRAQIHSPHYVDTFEGLKYLLDVADKLDFQVLFKPHPNLFPRPLEISHDRLIYVREANATDCVNAADVTVTLLSSLAYISLAHDKPTVLMGRNTLSGVHAAYEMDDFDDLEKCMSAALANADHEERMERYVRHIAALLKGYLFPYGDMTDFSMLSTQDCADKLCDMMGLSSSRAASKK
nr:glycosyltransferase [uncultured Cohaesibacter sp.]